MLKNQLTNYWIPSQATIMFSVTMLRQVSEHMTQHIAKNYCECSPGYMCACLVTALAPQGRSSVAPGRFCSVVFQGIKDIQRVIECATFGQMHGHS